MISERERSTPGRSMRRGCGSLGDQAGRRRWVDLGPGGPATRPPGAPGRVRPLTQSEPWTVLFQQVVRKFLDSDPDPFTVAMVSDWIESLRRDGPPTQGVNVLGDDETYLALVRRARLVCRYFLIIHERHIVLDRFEQP